MAHLFESFKLREVNFKNRIGMSPMCQYSSREGQGTDWHFVHLGSRAVGGAGLIVVEATAVEKIGRISPDDSGLWEDSQVEPFQRIGNFIRSQGAVWGIQLAHAGRKASTWSPFKKGERPDGIPLDEGGWTTVAPSAIPFAAGYGIPEALTVPRIIQVQDAFRQAASRAQAAGFQLIEIHAAHGYLIHSFLSPLSNHRTDQYGGSFENRIRFLIEIVQKIRTVWSEAHPLAVRLSCTDWVEGGWTLEDTIRLSVQLKKEGVDLIDCSSGGNVSNAAIPVGPNYQVPFSRRIKAEAQIATAAVGMITQAAQADAIIRTEEADMVFLAREMLRDPYWPIHAAVALNRKATLPVQYGRAY
jgi:2,4-dienoyl-CoA reductase-like NADH-dependent reductase (Old Yellow Enzyme family)